MSTLIDTIGTNLKSVTDRIQAACERSGRTPEDVVLVAVTKTVGVEEMRTLANLGVKTFGENRVQVATQKYDELKPEIPDSCWHFIGNLQRNKVKYIVERFDRFHALDNLGLAENTILKAICPRVQPDLFLGASDPGETTNLVFDYPEKADSMRSKIMKWRKTL